MENVKEKIAKKIAKTAVNTVKGTVGKSLPGWIYEVEVPVELKKENLEKMVI